MGRKRKIKIRKVRRINQPLILNAAWLKNSDEVDYDMKIMLVISRDGLVYPEPGVEDSSGFIVTNFSIN